MPTEAPQSPVDVCNLALEYIAESPISSIEDPKNNREETMSRWYDHVRRMVLREYVWNFAQKVKEIPRTEAGTGTYADAYNLPNDFVRLNSVGLNRGCPIKHYDLRDGQIHASEGDSIWIYYTRDVREVTKMDELFIDILAIRLALKVAYKFTKKKSVVEGLMGLLRTEEPKASSVDGQERIPRRIEKSKYLTARRYGNSRSRNHKYYSWDD